MLQFISGLLVGGIIGFLVFVICNIAGTYEQSEKTTGEDDAGSK